MQGSRRVSVGVVLGAFVAGIVACSIERTDDPTDAVELNSADAGDPNGGALPERAAGASVLEHHGNATRDGYYVDPAFGDAALASLHRDATFDGTVVGNVYAQPLYVEQGPGGREAFIVATEQNHVTALDGAGRTIWDKTFGAPATANLPCGNIRPLGVTGTPVIDLASRTIFFDAMITPDGNRTFDHKIFAISLDDGSTKPGWPVSFAAVTNASSAHHNQRGALALVNGTLYVPYGGHFGD
jgi:hypothetical protein